MYSKEQASALRQSFWTTFGQYISPQLSADGLKINWVSYKTGIRHVQFRMTAENNYAEIAIELNHPDVGIQELYYEQFKELRIVFEATMQEDWDWLPHLHEKEKIISKISKRLNNVSVYNRNDWPALISFFKPRIIALDDFWSTARYSFEALL